MEHSVKLARLPEGVDFPDRLRDRMSYDPVRGWLTYKGFMTKCTYDELVTLSDDVDYHRALEHLFVLTSEEVAPRAGSRGLPAAIGLAVVAAALLAAVVMCAMLRSLPGAPAGSVTATSGAS